MGLGQATAMVVGIIIGASLDRVMTQLGFRGVMLFSNVNGIGLDDRHFLALVGEKRTSLERCSLFIQRIQ